MDNDRLMAGILGVIVILFGLAALAFPSVVISSLVILIGAILVVVGVLTGGIALSAESGLPKTLLLTSALISLIIGLLALISPFIAIVGIAYLIGLWLLINGITTVAYAFSVSWATHRILTGFWGVVGILISLFLFINPALGMGLLTSIIGIFFIFFGIIFLIMAIFYWKQ